MSQTPPDPQDVPAELGRLRAEIERLAAELAAARARAAALEVLALEDPLTGLLNRRGFWRDLTRAIAHRARYGAPIALCLADLDGFKPVNDQHGHGVGDKALAQVAAMLRRNLRASDSVGRIGGDEFAVLMWEADESAVLRRTEALEAMVGAAPLALDDRIVSLGLSIGVAMLQPEDTPEAALARADEAMYARKAARMRLRR